MGTKITLFGPPQIEKDGAIVPLKRSRSLALLAYLAARREAVRREAIATLIWPDFDSTSSRNNLRRELSNLKKALGKNILVSDRSEVRLTKSDDEIWIDTNAFEVLIGAWEKHNHSDDRLCENCRAALEEAIALYTADFLTGFTLPDSPAFDDWTYFQAGSLRRRLAQGLQGLISDSIRTLKFDKGIDYAQRWLNLDNLNEAARRELMKLYYWDGQQAAAIHQYEACQRILANELGIDPDPVTTSLFEAIKSRTLASPAQTINTHLAPPTQKAAASSLKHSLPSDTTPFIGRDEETKEIERLLVDPAIRLLTILGVGGIGKTRMSLHIAQRQLKNEGMISDKSFFPDGIFFIPLAPLNQPDEIMPTIAKVLDFTTIAAEGQIANQVLDYLKTRRLLLILDNIEHMLSAQANEVVVDILENSPGIKILVTSRTRLNIHGESIYSLDGLTLPQAQTAAELTRRQVKEIVSSHSALALFEQSARRVRADFRITAERLPTVAQIGRLVHAMPLGIELAAAWLGLLSLKEIAAEIEQSLDFLEGDWHELPERQKSLRAVFQSSWKLLSKEEQQAMVELTVFQGGFTRDATRQVNGLSPRQLLTLLNKSWLQRVGRERFQIHELLRQYAGELLQQNSRIERQVRTRHATYFAVFLKSLERQIGGPQMIEALAALSADIDNVRLAWTWLVESGEIDFIIENMLPSLYRYSEFNQQSTLIIALATEALSSSANTAITQNIWHTVQAQFFINGFPVRFEMHGSVVPYDSTHLKLTMEQINFDDLLKMGQWGIYLAGVHSRFQEPQQGLILLRQLADFYRDSDKRWEEAQARQYLGRLIPLLLHLKLIDFNPFPSNEDDLLIAITLFDELGELRESAFARRFLGDKFIFQGKFAEAKEQLQITRNLFQKVDDWTGVAYADYQLAGIYYLLGEFDNAFLSWKQISDLYRHRGAKRYASYVRQISGYQRIRYGDAEIALEEMEDSLALAQEAQDVFGIAWSLWNIGEIYRLMGDIPHAQQYYQESLPLFEKAHETIGMTYFHRGLGAVALDQGHFEAAVNHFQDALDGLYNIDHPWGAAYFLTGRGRAQLALGDLESARQSFQEAFHQADIEKEWGILLFVLGGIAAYTLSLTEDALAVEIGRFVWNHPFSWRETKQYILSLFKGKADVLQGEPIPIQYSPPSAFLPFKAELQAILNKPIRHFPNP